MKCCYKRCKKTSTNIFSILGIRFYYCDFHSKIFNNILSKLKHKKEYNRLVQKGYLS